ncbi:MAG: hypothetical protein HY922_14070, partial [Elusimicrobia bacterium]|nr:hypothetical protein [Elusimicrobiota bacterium]
MGLIFTWALLVLAPPAWTQVPAKFTYQGVVHESGVAVSGNRNMVISLYAASAGGVPLWSSASLPVSVSTGLFQVVLAPTGIDWEAVTPWLEVQVGAVTLSPREQLTSSPYAIAALHASTATAASAVFKADTIASLNATANGGITISSNLFVTGGSVGIGTTSPALKLDVAGGYGVSGSTVVTSTRTFWAADGAVAAPSYAFGNDPSMGIYRPAVNQIGFTVQGAQRGYFGASGLSVSGSVSASAGFSGDGSALSNLSGVSLAAGSVDSTKLAAGAVDTAKLGSDSVTTVKIADLNVTTGKINDGAIVTAKLGADSVI